MKSASQTSQRDRSPEPPFLLPGHKSPTPRMAQSQNPTIDIVVEFTGGLEMLFDNKNKLKVSVPATGHHGSPANIKFLVCYLCENFMRDPRKELFVVDGAVY